MKMFEVVEKTGKAKKDPPVKEMEKAESKRSGKEGSLAEQNQSPHAPCHLLV